MMNYPDTAPVDDPPAFSLWPDALAAGEEMMAWAKPAVYAQLGVDGEGIPLDILDSVLAWGRSGSIDAFNSQTNFVSIFVLGTEDNLHLS